MATSYTSLLGFALPVTGELSGTWGTVVNDSVTSLVESSIAGSATASVTSGNWTLSTTGSGAANEARCAILIPTGSPGVSRNIIAPSSSKAYIVDNKSDAAVVLKGAATAGATVAAGTTALVAWDGTDFVLVSQDLANATGTLPVAKGGTGITSFGSGIATFLGTPSSANLAAAVTNETGSGALVFATSPTLVTPVLGTPSSGTLSSCTVDGTNAVGFRTIPQNSQSAAYTLVLADSGKHIFHPSADTTARTFTIPANSSVAFPIGTAVTFINQNGAGVITIAITTDTMRLSPAGTTGSRTLAANGSATAIKVTSTEWLISGSGLT